MTNNFDAAVIAAFGRHLLVRSDAGDELRARPFGRDLQVVCGDRVICASDARSGETHVLDVRPRRNALFRANVRGGAEPVVANLSLMLAVLAPNPLPDFFVLDRYLCAAHCAAIPALLVLNKCELETPAPLEEALAAYRVAGYDWLPCSARTGAGLDRLAAVTATGRVAVLVGQSGVGKSSLIGALAPHSNAQVGELVRDEEGRHTTTASRAFDLPGGGVLIDSPGVRDFAPAIGHLEPGHLGFAEIDALRGGCRFADCRHLREPTCAVRAAVDAKTLSARRYESYRRLRRLYDDLNAARGPGPRASKRPERRR